MFSIQSKFFAFKSQYAKLFFFSWNLLLLKSVAAACGPNCLKCSSSDQCQLCDFSNKKVLDGQGGCADSVVSRCQIAVSASTCSRCEPPLRFDPSQGECVSGEIESCASYGPSGQCTRCQEGHYLKSPEECARLEEKGVVRDCREYQEIQVDLPSEGDVTPQTGRR